tara:strand:+ start:347 stop:658 length:312 start_codon:yes stop_codon:yes gene_type:complete
MSKRKLTFIDKIANDKKSHIVLGLLINPFIIIGFLILGFLIVPNHFIWFGYLGIIPCCLAHYGIELWQLKTGKGQYEKLDAVAGSSSSLLIGIVIAVIHIMIK